MNPSSTLRLTGFRRIPFWTVPLLGTMSVGVAWLSVGPIWVIAILAGLVLAGVALSSFSWAVAIVLVVRTSLDLYYDQNLYLGTVRISAASVFSLAITCLLIATYLASRSHIPRSEIIQAFGLLIVGSSIGVLTTYARFGPEGSVALRELVRLFVLLVWYIFLYERMRITGDARPFVRAVMLASLLPLSIGVWDFLTGTGIETKGVIRIYSTFVDPNAFGFYLVFLIMFCFAHISAQGHKTAWFVLGFAIVCIVLTYSRGAWIALMIAAPLFWLLTSRRRLIIGLIFIAFLLAAYPTLSSRLASDDYSGVLHESRTGVTTNSFSFRVLIWRELLKLWTVHPWLGWGLESTTIINPIRLMPENRGYGAHNDVVRYLVETGVIGFVFYAYFLGMLGRGLYRRARQLVGHSLELQSLAALAVYAAVIVQSMGVSEPLHHSSFLFHFLGMAAVLDGCAEFQRTHSTPSPARLAFSGG